MASSMLRASQLASTFSRYRWELESCGRVARLQLPSVQLHVDRGGRLDVPALIGMLSSARVFVYHTPCARTELAKGDNAVVSVSKTTRKPIPLADWWLERHAHQARGDRPSTVQLSLPSQVHTYRANVRWSDTDHYGHMTFTHYVKFCLDAATDGARAGALFGLKDDLTSRTITKVESTFRRECTAGQEINVHVWQSDHDTLHFLLERLGGQDGGARLFESSISLQPLVTVGACL